MVVNLILNNGEPGSNTLQLMPKNALPYKFLCQRVKTLFWFMRCFFVSKVFCK
ncbi:hypothetical protein HanXRQr2_Chr11g0482141 [Helianthus annuus]|uniref:Uncharacterized protein n=1 Tax=Helianthus annuus TaxID=4232 RepID=A0A9K3MZC8_HELAN|nr:hypothetical protein HanXRQr2_Chr11g0482141 [Helianthus annuus]